MIVEKKLTVIQVLLLLVIIACGVYVGKYFYDSNKAQNGFEELKRVVKENSAKDVTDSYIDARAENGMIEGYYELYLKNNDFTGWLTIPDTIIDYPVMHSSDNEFYLHRDFNKEYQYCGIPFLDYQCNDNSKNAIIYAHNMKSGTMFAVLSDYAKKEFYEGHKTILYDTLYERGEYEVFAAFPAVIGKEDEFKYYEYTEIDDQKLQEYINKAKERSVIDTGVQVTADDKILTLSTCAYDTTDERFVVTAKKMK